MSLKPSVKPALLIKLVTVFVIYLVAVFGSVHSALGGDSRNAVPGRPAGSYDISAFENINLFTGSLDFSIPYFELSGRGGLTLPLKTPIQNLWYSERHVEQCCCDEFGYCQTTEYWTYHNKQGGSWLSIKRNDQNQFEQINQGLYAGVTLSSLTFSTPDGTEHVLYDIATKGMPYRGNFYTSPNTPTPGYSRGNIFRSMDGSDITFVSNAPILDAVPPYGIGGTITGTLMTKDGTRYEVNNSRIISIKDRNGNVIQFEFESLPSVPGGRGKITKVVSSTGNEVEIISGMPPPSPIDPPAQWDDIYRYKGAGGITREVKLHIGNLQYALRPAIDGYPANSIKTIRQLFDDSNSTQDWVYDPKVLMKIEYPDGRFYEFKYNSYGELSMVNLPSGGRLAYEYGDASLPVSLPQYHSSDERRVVERRVYDENNSLESVTKYDQHVRGANYQYQGYAQEEHFAPDGNGQLNRLSKTKHYFNGDPKGIIGNNMLPFEGSLYINWDRGKEYKTEHFDSDGTTLLRKIETTWQQKNNSQVPWWTAVYNQPSNDPRITAVKTTLADSGQVTLTTFNYDDFNNLTDEYLFEYGDGTPGNLVRQTHTDYLTDTNYTSSSGVYLRSLPIHSWVGAPVSNSNVVPLPTIDPDPDPTPPITPTPTPTPNAQMHIFQRIRYEYDNYAENSLISRVNVVGHDSTNYNVANSLRGNVTKVTSYADAQNETGAINVSSQYDILGNIVKTIDAKGNVSTIGYEDNFGIPDGNATTSNPPSQLNGKSTYAFPTSTTNAVSWTGYIQYDYFTGQAVNVQDINGIVSKSVYNDMLDRPTQTVTAVGTALEAQSSIVYDDVNRKITTTSDLNALNDNFIKSESYYDGLGRTIETRSYETSTTYRATKTQYDALGRPYKHSNPFRPGDTLLWTQSYFDALGRVTQVKTPDNAVVLTNYSGSATTVTDQAGKVRRSIANALGQLIRVDEPDASGALGTISNPNQPTSYENDVLGNLTTVTQGAQTRIFTYDSLSRLLIAANPESGTISYGYDNNGNLTSKTDARNITTSFTYDVLNRITQKSYNDIPQTPTVTYTYDNATNAKGKLTKVSSSVSTTEYTSFDIIGRVAGHKQTTNSTDYTTAYSYNLAGGLLTETYPSGRIVQNTLNAAGALSIVKTKVPGGKYFVRAANFVYNAAGAVQSLALGNNKYETTQFNSRLQPTQIGLGTSTTDTSLMKLEYHYGTTVNNGNVLSQTITVPGLAQPFVQNYNYDSLNRLASATEANNSTQTWTQSFGYDRFGNRNITAGTGATSLTFNPANNRITTTGYTYDASGNTTTDPLLRTFVYDGENKQTSVSNSGGDIGLYSYDGDGKRIKKIDATGGTLFLYDAAGRLVEEVFNAAPVCVEGEKDCTVPGPVTTSYVYAGSRLLSTETLSGTMYLTADQLGSPRINTDGSGNVAARHDYLPFGEEITSALTAQRSGYFSDSHRKKFTGYERDVETGLDFAEARMHNFSLGRFSSPDLLGGDSSIPQSLNRYSYVVNNPINFIDPSGLIWLTRDSKSYEWVDDTFYNSKEGQEKYKGWNVGNGDVALITMLRGSYANGKYDHLIGKYASHNKDGSLSEARDPNLDFVDEVEVLVFDSTFPQMSLGSWFGHVAYNINGEAWSWELHGWAGGDNRPTIERYMSQNTHRSATGYVINGGADFNKQLAALLKNGYNGFDVASGAGWGGYSASGNNCGESFCRAVNSLGLPRNNGIFPADHGAYIEREFGGRGLLTTINRYPRLQTLSITHPAAR